MTRILSRSTSVFVPAGGLSNSESVIGKEVVKRGLFMGIEDGALAGDNTGYVPCYQWNGGNFTCERRQKDLEVGT